MRSGCILIKFKEGLSNDKEQRLISGIYAHNKDYIDGMEYSGFDIVKPIETIKSFIIDKIVTHKASDLDAYKNCKLCKNNKLHKHIVIIDDGVVNYINGLGK